MEKCQALEAKITQSEQFFQMLMQAVLKEALEPKNAEVISAKTKYKIEEILTWRQSREETNKMK